MFVRGSGCGYRVEWIEDIHACTGDIRHISGDDQVTGFAGFITDAGEALARTGDQTLARWVILDAIEDGAATLPRSPVDAALPATRQAIHHGTFTSVPDLIAAIGTFIDAYNGRCKAFVWIKPADEVLAHCKPPNTSNYRPLGSFSDTEYWEHDSVDDRLFVSPG